MNRMLQGDVGSGKTVVAGLALYSTLLAQRQSILMAPTEILAKQHFNSITKLLGKQARIGIYTRSELSLYEQEFESKTKKGRKEEFFNLVRLGKIDIAIGTHALLSEGIDFSNLGLVIVDEQHRFGVEQRKAIKEKSGDSSTVPHFLSMTATPIPRTLALAVYGDLDVSTIDEMPPGRKPVKTRYVEPKNRQKAYDFIRAQVKKGRQVFVVCPMIEEGGMPGQEKKSVLQEYEKLSKHIFSDLRVGFVHGKLKASEKNAAMSAFAVGDTHILVSTSVIEVGVNIPNASVMMIEGAEHFGLAQLHQFRGRVGRSEHQSYCFLFAETPSEKAAARLTFFEKHTDGFKVAEFDLEQRGPGEVYGKQQSGMMQLQFATLHDARAIKLAREHVRDIDFEKYPVLRDKVKEWERRVHLE